jgi:integrase
MTVRELCGAYLKGRDKLVKESSYMRYRRQIENHIEPYFGERDADKVTIAECEDFYKAKLDEGLSENYVHTLGVLLRSVFLFGEKRYGIHNAPAKTDLVKQRVGKVETLSDNDIVKVLKYGARAEKIALSMGLRIGEICGLQGKDYKDGVVSIARTVQRLEERNGGTRIYISTPKTQGSARRVPVPKHLRKYFEGAADDEYILGGYSPTDPRTIAYRWKSLCRAVGIEPIKFHALRHTFATKAIEMGMPVKTLSEILGHANVGITMNLYCHPSDKHKEEMMAKLWEGVG